MLLNIDVERTFPLIHDSIEFLLKCCVYVATYTQRRVVGLNYEIS